MKKIVFFLLSCCGGFSAQTFGTYVNPFIGTGGHGHTFPGAVLPFGMVQLSPDTRVDGSWDGCSGYHYSDSKIYGFTHTHLSGTGCSDFGDILIMPYIGAQSVDPAVYSSQFKHQTEKASPGYYEVQLEDDQIKAELTTTNRVGIHRYTFRKSADANIVLDLLHRDKLIESMIGLPDSVTITGWRISEAWAKHQVVYYAVRFSRPYKKREIANNGKFIVKYGKFKIRPESGVFTFDLSDGEPLLVKVAISPVSVDGALRNLNAEAPHWDFEKYKTEAANIWEKQLAKIEISEKDQDRRTVFYTALYHASIHPSLNMDVDGQFRGRDDKIHKADGFSNYSVFSLWDTYRAFHPLMTIIDQRRTSDFMQSFLAQYQHAGRLPVWELAANETDCMIGFHSVSVLADAITKRSGSVDRLKAFDAMLAAASYSGFGSPEFNKKGFLSVEDESESVSKTLEYCYDNWCIAKTAEFLGKKEEAALHYRRSLGYRQLFDASTGFMRPRKNGNWLSPFYANEINNHFTEGNSWQYSFYAPHDVSGLINLHGGKENFELKLNELFSTSSKTRGREQADVTGLIGQYAHGNEPSHHMAFLYNFVDKPEKASAIVKKIGTDFYKNAPDGLIGNEDCGQMSAWYVFSALGLYPVCPGDGRYVLVQPQMEESKIHLENGMTFTLSAKADINAKWTALKLNGSPAPATELLHSDLMKGGRLEFVFSAAEPSQLVSPISTLKVPPPADVPLIQSASQVFKGTLTVTLAPLFNKTDKVLYRLGASPETVYTQPLILDKTSQITARAVSGADTSAMTSAIYYKLKNDYLVKLVSTPNSQYAADGPQSLVDGMPLETDWRKGNWLGVQTENFECTVDLLVKKTVQEVSLSCLQDSRSWILFPTSLQVFGSADGKKYTLLGEFKNEVQTEDNVVSVKDLKVKLSGPAEVRHLKVVATQYGTLPANHAGKGGDSFIFAGELDIR